MAEILSTNSVKMDLAFILAHLDFMPDAITKLEEPGLPLTEALTILKDAENKVNMIPGPKGAIIKTKLEAILRKNPGLLHIVKEVRECLTGTSTSMGLPSGLSLSDIANLKFAPITSTDVERTFSMYKCILTDRRHSLTQENLSKINVTHCFFNYGSSE